MIRRPPRSTRVRSSAASDVYKRQLWASMFWSAVVWVGGEFFGGLFATAVSWLSGAPGAILVYVMAAALLLVRWDRWSSGNAERLARRCLLYTSDAADDLTRVDLGGRR